MIAYLAKLLGSIFTMKAFLGGLFFTIGAVVVYNLVVEIIQEVLNFGLAKIGAVSASGLVGPSFSGFAAWVAIQMRFPESVSVVVTFAALGFVLRKIPFLRW